MLKHTNRLCLCILLITVICFTIPITAHASENTRSSYDEQLDSIELTLDQFGSKVGSTLMFGGSSPVSFKGEARLNVQYHSFKTYPYWFTRDRAYIQSGWEGNENLFRLGMVVRAGRNTVLWSKIGFQTTLPGMYPDMENDTSGGLAHIHEAHDKHNFSARIHEDMGAGIAIRTKPASFWLNMGAIQWIEASPLTIWNGQNRLFAWEYLPYEIEQPIARYYEYNIAKGEKTGRAAWNKREFNGIRFESISLPGKLNLMVLYAKPDKMGHYEREWIDANVDLGYDGDPDFTIRHSGVGESYTHVLHTRIAALKALKGITLGANFCRFDVSDDIMHAKDEKEYLFKEAFDIVNRPGRRRDRGFYKEPLTFSIDAKGEVSPKLSFHTDIGIGKVDTTWLIFDTTISTYPFDRKTKEKGSFKPALYSNIKIGEKVPVQFDVAAIARGYYAPKSFVSTGDYFWAFNSNRVSAGKFIGGAYGQNLAGLQATVSPKLSGYGHMRVRYGQHFQLQKARDLLYFPYRLNGQSMFSVFHSSYKRWGGPVDFEIYELDYAKYPWFTTEEDAVIKRYQKRLGDESFLKRGYNNPPGVDAGGIYSDYLGMFECFVPYEDSAQAAQNLIMFNKGNVFTPSYSVPVHRKYTFNLELDAAYDIGPIIGYKNSLFLGGYAAINGISSVFKPLAFNAEDEDMMLWSLYLRFEPAIALTNKFYILGLLGYENWRSDKAWIATTETNITSGGEVDTAVVKKCPIDYRDVAYGLGCDLSITNRVQFHGRVKWLKHEDFEFKKYAKESGTDYGKNPNCWSAPFISGEVKMWF